MKTRNATSFGLLVLLGLVLALCAAGCARQAPATLTTQPPAQMEKTIQQNAQNYAAYKAAHPTPGG